jgi:hypothetical protein
MNNLELNSWIESEQLAIISKTSMMMSLKILKELSMPENSMSSKQDLKYDPKTIQ